MNFPSRTENRRENTATSRDETRQQPRSTTLRTELCMFQWTGDDYNIRNISSRATRPKVEMFVLIFIVFVLS